METRALRFHGADDLRLETVPLRAPGSGDVLVAVDACAVCESDFAFLAGSARPRSIPVTLGHEIAATVAASQAPGWHEGDAVVVGAGLPCGECGHCVGGRVNVCEHLTLVGVDVDGGLADRLVVPGAALVRRPLGIDPGPAATADAAAAAYHAVVRRGELRQGHVVVVLGATAPAHYALQIAQVAGAAPVIAAVPDAAAGERARALGADEVLVLEAGRSVGREIKLLSDGGADVAADFSGEPATVDAAVKSLRPGGIAVTAGLGTDAVRTVPSVLWSLHEYELRGSFGSLPGDLDRVLAWLDDGTLDAPDTATVPLAEASSALPEHDGHQRLVVVP